MVCAPHSNNLVSPCLPEPRSGLGNASRVRPGPGRKWQTGSAHGGVRCRNHSLRFVTGLLPNSLQRLTRDGWLLFLTRFTRLFAYGSPSVILVFYLFGLGLTEAQKRLWLTIR